MRPGVGLSGDPTATRDRVVAASASSCEREESMNLSASLGWQLTDRNSMGFAT